MTSKPEETLTSVSISDALMYLGPGAALLVTVRLWGASSRAWMFTTKLAENQGIGLFVFAMSSYSLGLFIHEWCKVGSMRFMQVELASRTWAFTGTTAWTRVGAWRVVKNAAIVTFHWMPLPVFDRSAIEAQLLMNDQIKAISNASDSSYLQSPWDRLEIYRLVANERLARKAGALLRRADREHQHLTFLLGLSLVAAVVSLEALVGGAFACAFRKWSDLLVFVEVFASAGTASLFLRLVASRMWELELLLTCQLATIDTP